MCVCVCVCVCVHNMHVCICVVSQKHTRTQLPAESHPMAGQGLQHVPDISSFKMMWSETRTVKSMPKMCLLTIIIIQDGTLLYYTISTYQRFTYILK